MVEILGSLLFIIPAWLTVRYYTSKTTIMKVMCLADKFYSEQRAPEKHPHCGSIYYVLGVHIKGNLMYYELVGFPLDGWDVRDFAVLSELDEKILHKDKFNQDPENFYDYE